MKTREELKKKAFSFLEEYYGASTEFKMSDDLLADFALSLEEETCKWKFDWKDIALVPCMTFELKDEIVTHYIKNVESNWIYCPFCGKKIERI